MIEKCIEFNSMIDVNDFSKAISKFENNLRKKVKNFSKTISKFEKIIDRWNNRFRKDHKWKFCIDFFNVLKWSLTTFENI